MAKKYVEIINLDRPLSKPLQAVWCDSYLCKLRGLSWRWNLPEREALLMVHSRESRADTAIHMFGMWYDLAIVWLNEVLEVVDVRYARRWLSIIVPREPALYYLEMHTSRLKEFEIGDRLSFEEVSIS
jgi:uncharacterized membrane protein (UPF0127 family)